MRVEIDEMPWREVSPRSIVVFTTIRRRIAVVNIIAYHVLIRNRPYERQEPTFI